MTTSKSFRRAIRGILALGALCSLLLVPTSAFAVRSADNLSSYNYGKLWATATPQTKVFTFERSARACGLFGLSTCFDKISAATELVSTPAGAFTIQNDTCNVNFSFSNGNTCKVTVKFNPGVGPDATGLIKAFSTFDNDIFTDWDHQITLRGGSAQQQIGCVTDEEDPRLDDADSGVVLCEVGTDGPGCVVDGNDKRIDNVKIFKCQEGKPGERGPGCVVRDPNAPVPTTALDVDTSDPNAGYPDCPVGPKGDDGDDGQDGAKGDPGAKGDAGVTGPAGPVGADGAAAPQSAALGGGPVVTKVVSVRTSCYTRRNKAKRRVATCKVWLPAGTPASTLTMYAGGNRIATIKVGKGTRVLTVSKVLPKAIKGWVSIKVRKS